MKTNPILKELRETRDRLADEAGGDMRELFAMVRKQEAVSAASGGIFIPAPAKSAVLREEPSDYRIKPS